MAIEDEGQLNMRRQTNILLFSSSVEMRLVGAGEYLLATAEVWGHLGPERLGGEILLSKREGEMLYRLYIPFWMLYMLEILCMPFPLFLFYMFQLFLVARYVQ